MPSKARQLAKAMVENPIIEDMVTTPAAIPQTIVTETTTAATAIDANFNYATVDVLPGSANVGDQAFVQSTNRLYIWSGAGWYSIALINSTPTWDSGGQPAATYILDTDSPQDATIINLSASDPEDLPISYSYITSGSMDSMATISQDSSVFTITPKSASQVGEGVELTGSITFRATDGINILPQVSSFTLNFVTAIENSNHTVMLTSVVDTSDNNNITDASSNSHTITVNGDARAGTFSPYRHGGYSTYFENNTSYYRATSSSDFDIGGTGDWSYEAWVYPTDLSNTYPRGFGLGPYYSDPKSFGVLLQDPDNGGYITVYWSPNTRHLISSTTLPLHSWSHIMVCRSGNDIGLFFNGTRVAHNSNYTASIPTGNTYLFAGATGNNNEGFLGYIKDVRFINGSHPYDASSTSFNVPTEALEITSNTKFLGSSGLPYEKDISTSDHTITVNGSPSIKPFSLYDHIEYSPTDHGGSMYFDGNGDAIEIADNDDFDFGTGDLTIECWVYPEVTGNNYPGFLGTTAGWGSVAASGMRFDNLGDSKFQMSWYGPGDPFLETQSTYLHDQWYHFVVTRTGGNTWRMFINGILEDVATNSTPYDISVGGHNLQVGGKTWDGGNGWFKGNVADLRLTKGSVVTEYQTSSTTTGTQIFTPRTTPITSSGSELHIKGTDASIIDKSQSSNLKLFGNTTGSTTQVKFANTKSMYFDGTGDYIRGPTISDLNIGTGDFTVECWLYETTANTNRGIWDGRGTYISTDGFTFTRIGTDTFRVWSGSALITTGSFTIQNTWNHCALVRNSGTLTIYINGTSSGTPVSNSTNFSSSGTFIIGAGMYTNSSDPNAFITGYIQDFRVGNYARYTANFTPPTSEFEG